MPVYAGLGVLKRLFYGGEEYAFMVSAKAAGLTGADMQAAALAVKGNLLAVGEETLPRLQTVQSGGTLTTQSCYFSYFTARKTETINNIRMVCASAAAVTTTFAKMAIYSIAANGNGTLLAGTANDTGLFAAAFTPYVRALTTPVSKVAGQRYAVAVLVAATTMPNLNGASFTTNTEQNIAPRIAGKLSGQADLPASFTDAGLSNSDYRFHYATVTP